jgi:AraC-like DNA-binding protein
LITTDQAIQAMDQSIEILRLDDLLTRLTVLLLVPFLRRDLRGTAQAAPAQRTRLQEITEWIEAHLHQPIALSDLERMSHFSRRTLQYAFRSEFGCTPMQWIRTRRLERAKAQLLNARAGDTVASIARATGYVSTSAFSRDFRKHHGCRPVDVFRRYS